jgi:hypothetical protein
MTLLKIVKIQNTKESFVDQRPQVFKKSPRLYLELIENKAKINQDVINSEYKHEYASEPEEKSEKSDSDSDLNSDDNSQANSDVESFRDDESDVQSQKSYNSNDDQKSVESRVSKESYVSDTKSDIASEVNSIKSNNTPEKKYESNEFSSREKRERTKSRRIDEIKDDVSVNSLNKFETNSKSSSPDLGRRLKELLVDSDEEKSPVRERGMKNKYSKKRDERAKTLEIPPSFAELESKGEFVKKKDLRNLDQISKKEFEDDDAKRELMFKFEMLRKSYPSATIPIYSVHTDYRVMLNSYEDCVRRLSLDSNVEKYKQYLIYLFTAVEFVLGKFCKFDMSGYAQQQMLTMNSYDKLLIELGEKSYLPEGSKFPVEVRLLFLVIVNTVFFIITKMVMKKTGANLMGMFNQFSGLSNNSNSSVPKKPKMKGPDIIDLDLDQ